MVGLHINTFIKPVINNNGRKIKTLEFKLSIHKVIMFTNICFVNLH